MPSQMLIARYNGSAPGGATNTLRGLTHSSDRSREGLAMDATQECGTRGGYDRHLRAGEATCDECRAAQAAHLREWRVLHSATCVRCGNRRTRNQDAICGHCAKALGNPRRECSVDGCSLPFWAKGFCSTHYATWRRNGKPGRRTLSDRFWMKVCFTGFCWEWTADRAKSGHGRIRVDGRTQMAHRIAYELLVGPIPEGLELDHLCRNTCCVNPDHLDPVTHLENMRRGFSPSMIVSQAKRRSA